MTFAFFDLFYVGLVISFFVACAIGEYKSRLDVWALPPLTRARAAALPVELCLDLASEYFPAETIDTRWQEVLAFESQVVSELPVRAALH